MSPEQIKKNRLSLPLWDTPIHIPGVCKCSQFSETNQSKPSSSYYEQSISISLGTKWTQVLFIPVVHLDFSQCFVIINNTGEVSLYVHLCTTEDFPKVASTTEDLNQKFQLFLNTLDAYL